MTVQFPLIRSLLVGLVAALAGGIVGGCADSSSQTDLPDIPAILQVMVFQPEQQGTDYLTDPASGFAITYEREALIPIGGNSAALSDYGNCFLFDATGAAGGSPSPECRRADQNANCHCPTYVDGALVCASSGPLIGRCVTDASATSLPEARHALPAGAVIRLVVGKLLDGATLEHFACACQGDALVTTDPTVKDNITNLSVANCAGEAWSDDPRNCSVCGSGVRTTSGYETHCFDSDNNGLPDTSSLIAGVATLTCSITGTTCPADLGWSGSGGSCTYVTAEGDGYFYPSGNQFQSSVTGLSGVGPAIVISPGSQLPTDSECSVVVADTVKFQTGETLSATAPTPPPTFHTEVIELSITSPDTINITNSTTLVLDFNANVPLNVADLSIEVTDVNATAFDVLDENATPDISASGKIEATFTKVHLTKDHIFTFTITGTATDAFGQSHSIDQDATNITAVIPAMTTAKR